ncbi:MAG: ribbon-helix-helix domain-containing protein [Thaumarchaeota archaeon]|nr:ribbon-helix-helix domain-containing protein [Nitrososphaerota archaeon]
MVRTVTLKIKDRMSLVLPTRYSKREVEEIERARRVLGLSSRSAFIREAVLSKLEEIKQVRVVEMQDVSVDQASEMIDRYLMNKPGVHYVSELIEELGLEPRIAFEAVEKLVQGGSVRVRNKV